MSEAMTLGELLAEWEATEVLAPSPSEDMQVRLAVACLFAKSLRRVLHGTDEPCPECEGSGQVWVGTRLPGYPRANNYRPCPICHGTGRIKTPGLEDRLLPVVGPIALADMRANLRREIGGTTP